MSKGKWSWSFDFFLVLLVVCLSFLFYSLATEANIEDIVFVLVNFGPLCFSFIAAVCGIRCVKKLNNIKIEITRR